MNDGSKVKEKYIETLKKKTMKLDENLEKEFKFAQKMLKEKTNYETKLKKEIEDLLNVRLFLSSHLCLIKCFNESVFFSCFQKMFITKESKSVAEDHENKMTELHNELINESRKIKSRASVFGN